MSEPVSQDEVRELKERLVKAQEDQRKQLEAQLVERAKQAEQEKHMGKEAAELAAVTKAKENAALMAAKEPGLNALNPPHHVESRSPIPGYIPEIVTEAIRAGTAERINHPKHYTSHPSGHDVVGCSDEQSGRSEVRSVDGAGASDRRATEHAVEVPLRLREANGSDKREPSERPAQELRVRSSGSDGLHGEGADGHERLRVRGEAGPSQGEPAFGEDSRAYPGHGEETWQAPFQGRGGASQEWAAGRQPAEQPRVVVEEPSRGSTSHRPAQVGEESASTVRERVNHPRHYCLHPSGVECIDIVEHMTFNAGNAVKYLWRAGLKEGSPNLEDIKKAAWYINREIERLTK